MSHSAWLQLIIYLLVLAGLAWPLGYYLTRVFDGRWANACPRLQQFERTVCRLIGAQHAEMSWWQYATALVLFNVFGVVLVYAIQRLQGLLPLNPQALTAVPPDLAFNTAISFVTNTNWQAYSGETTLSYLTQMLALTVQNFASAATGLAVAIVFIRGFTRNNAIGVGNAWIDLIRATFYVLLPLSLILALALVSQGVIQNLKPYQTVQLTQPVSYQVDQKPVTQTTQTIAMGPVASQEAIKMIGTNGGGFFNANSAHPYENPTPLTNFMEMVSILLIPAALCFSFGQMVGDRRQGLTLLATMTLLFVITAALGVWGEVHANPWITHLGVDGTLGNLEGKETRFGIIASSLFATVTTAASCGAVNAMHDSLMPLSGFMPMWLMKLGEVVFGGVGSGLYGILIFAILAVFLSGLMIGRTPEYLGKKIEAFEMKMVSIAILITPFLVLGGTAMAVVTVVGKAALANPGAHGFSEILYAFASTANNNGSAFAGLSTNTPFYNILLGAAMWFGRFGVIIPVLAIAGRLAAKPKLAITNGTLPTHGVLFVILLTSTILIVGALNYIPALALGPIVEHLQLFAH